MHCKLHFTLNYVRLNLYAVHCLLLNKQNRKRIIFLILILKINKIIQLVILLNRLIKLLEHKKIELYNHIQIIYRGWRTGTQTIFLVFNACL